MCSPKLFSLPLKRKTWNGNNKILMTSSQCNLCLRFLIVCILLNTRNKCDVHFSQMKIRRLGCKTMSVNKEQNRLKVRLIWLQSPFGSRSVWADYLCTLHCSCCLGAKSCPTLLWHSTSCAAAHQAYLSMGLPRQEYWSGLPFSSPAHPIRVYQT